MGRKWYDEAAKWMKIHKPEDAELDSLQTEAAKLLGMSD